VTAVVLMALHTGIANVFVVRGQEQPWLRSLSLQCVHCYREFTYPWVNAQRKKAAFSSLLPLCTVQKF